MSKVYLITDINEKVKMVVFIKEKAIMSIKNVNYRIGAWTEDEREDRAPYYSVFDLDADNSFVDIDDSFACLQGWIIEKELY